MNLFSISVYLPLRNLLLTLDTLSGVRGLFFTIFRCNSTGFSLAVSYTFRCSLFVCGILATPFLPRLEMVKGQPCRRSVPLTAGWRRSTGD
jgi:hypothetical protein